MNLPGEHAHHCSQAFPLSTHVMSTRQYNMSMAGKGRTCNSLPILQGTSTCLCDKRMESQRYQRIKTMSPSSLQA